VIGVVYLVGSRVGPLPVREFLASYRRHPPGVEHELVVLFNAVDNHQHQALESELRGIEHRRMVRTTSVPDLAAYAWAAERLQYERICFFNSYSVILAPQWLAKLDHALDQPRAGLVGATGSWASHRSGVMSSLFLRNPHHGLLPKWIIQRGQLQEIQSELDFERKGRGSWPGRELLTVPNRGLMLARSLVAAIKEAPTIAEIILRFESFPNPHLRTNAFMVDRATFNNLQTGIVKRKMDAYLLESGRVSFTRQVLNSGLRTLVVASDGSFYDQDKWPLSNTFFQGDQEMLLIADNQTRIYQNGGLDRRRLLSTRSWGSQANPRLASGTGASW